MSSFPADEGSAPIGRSESRAFTSQEKITIALSSLGGTLEFFDFTIFIFLTPIISKVFFSAGQPAWIKEFLTLSIFALGWFARPLGGTVIAILGDRFGRKKLFMFTVFSMAVPTLLTGLIPSYETAGILAPLLLILFRLLQGIAIGGEVPGALTFVAEHISRERLGFACSLFSAMLYVGLLLGSASAAILFSVLSPDAQILWGWRLPFVFGGVLALVVVYLRRHLSETPLFEAMKKAGAETRTLPFLLLFKNYCGAMLFTLLYSALLSIVITGLFTFLPTPLQSIYKISPAAVSAANTAAIGALVVFGPLWGVLSDRIGLHRVMAIGCATTLIATLWFFYRISSIGPDGNGLLEAWVILGAASAFVCIVPALVTQVFSTRIRYTGFALPYNVGLAVFTGLLPIAAAWLNELAGRNSLCVLTAVICVVGIVAAPFMPGLITKAKDDDLAPIA